MKFISVSATLAFAMLGALPRADGCEVVAEPQLAQQLQAWLASHPEEERSCLKLVVVAESEAQTLVMTTRDGRVARRTIEAAEELEDTIDALLLAPPPPPRAAPPAQPPAEAVSAEPLTITPAAEPPNKVATLPLRSSHALFAATGLGWHPEPGIGLFAIETGWSWQPALAVVEAGVRWSPAITPGGSPLAGFTASSSDLWLGAGVPLLEGSGQRLDLLLRGGWQTFAESADNPDPAKKNAIDLSGEQWTIGGQLTHHRRLGRHVALRTGAHADLSLTGLRAKGASTKGLPPLPASGLALLVGLEFAP